MAAPCFIAWNGATAALTAALPSVTTGTAIKTMLQIKPGTPKIRIIEWGYSFDVVPTALVKVELVETGTVGATVTAFAAGDVAKYNDSTGPASGISLGTAASGYTSSAEGTVTASRLLGFDEEWAQSFKQQFVLGREPEVNGGNFLRVRATTATALNMVTYVIWEE